MSGAYPKPPCAAPLYTALAQLLDIYKHMGPDIEDDYRFSELDDDADDNESNNTPSSPPNNPQLCLNPSDNGDVNMYAQSSMDSIVLSDGMHVNDNDNGNGDDGAQSERMVEPHCELNFRSNSSSNLELSALSSDYEVIKL